VAVCREFSKLKNTLMPYLYTKAVEAHTTGTPVMRAMVMEFPQDIGAEDLDRQYMLGDAVLVAPVFHEDGSCDFYLPAGKWTHLLTGEEVEGRGWTCGTYDFFSLPVFVRGNSILPIGAHDDKPVYDYADGLTLRVYALDGKAERTVCNAKGEPVLNVTAENAGGSVTVTINGQAKDLKLLLVNVPAVKAVTGAKAEQTAQGVLLHVQGSKVTYEL